MSLAMTRPYAHPKTGVYWLRKAVPVALRPVLGRRELTQSLRTKDPQEARSRAPAVLTQFEASLTKARAAATETAGPPVSREIAALAGEWYRQRVGAYGDDTTSDLHHEIAFSLLEDDPDREAFSATDPVNIGRAEGLLKQHGFSSDTHSVERLAAALVRAETGSMQLLKRRKEGDWSPDTMLPTFPELRRSGSPGGTPGHSFGAILAGWALDKGMKLDARPMPRALYDRHRTLERLAAFLGHRDASRVTKADAVRWKESILLQGRHASTVRNDLSEMSAVWAWAIQNGKLPSPDNPFQGILPPKARKKGRDPRAFTDQEAAQILQAARSERGSFRWLPWVLCLTGARLNEICQSAKDDVTTLDGVKVIRIHDEGEGRTLKNADSRRTVPLHPALVADGFLDYVDGLPAGSSLWPDIRPDAVFGLRSTTAGRKMARWLRTKLAIRDPAISPNHSWRHWFIGACRKVVMPVEVRSAITGHSAKMDESAGYGDGMGTFVQVVAASMAKVCSPLSDAK